MVACVEQRQVAVDEICEQFGSDGLLSTLDVFAFAVELKTFNNVHTWPAQKFVDQATGGRGAKLKSEYACLPLGELLDMLADDLAASPEALSWREPA